MMLNAYRPFHDKMPEYSPVTEQSRIVRYDAVRFSAAITAE